MHLKHVDARSPIHCQCSICASDAGEKWLFVFGAYKGAAAWIIPYTFHPAWSGVGQSMVPSAHAFVFH